MQFSIVFGLSYQSLISRLQSTGLLNYQSLISRPQNNGQNLLIYQVIVFNAHLKNYTNNCYVKFPLPALRHLNCQRDTNCPFFDNFQIFLPTFAT